MFFSSQTEVYIYREPVDMRKGHDGLAGIVESEMSLELLSGSIFLFVNKSRRLCKAIYFDGSGLVIIHKRMEVGSIMNFLAFGKIQKITVSELALILDGASLRIRERGKKYVHGESKRRLKK
ncbi:MAG: IS66 family insertion sequence element accessory protein TnpB [Oligoflexia bacterium]|nr:IS66 family insertion sequence element accessory protein TnpB [Oligoflexia bacterium]|tara:strand:+ start:635 stop:1000 length:366 start_codon:yes stop_codon:yes gene_type:complete